VASNVRRVPCFEGKALRAAVAGSSQRCTARRSRGSRLRTQCRSDRNRTLPGGSGAANDSLWNSVCVEWRREDAHGRRHMHSMKMSVTAWHNHQSLRTSLTG
jgi:hypothetical protein